MKQKFGSSMAHLSVIKRKFPIFSLRASWPGLSFPHTVQWSGRMMVLPASHMQRKCFPYPWISHQLMFKFAHSAPQNSRTLHIARGGLHFLLTKTVLPPSILFYIILLIAIYYCDSFFSCLACCNLRFLFFLPI